MTTTATTSLHSPTMIEKVYLRVLAIVVVYFPWFYFVCRYYVASGELQGQSMGDVCGRKNSLEQTFHYNV